MHLNSVTRMIYKKKEDNNIILRWVDSEREEVGFEPQI